VSLTRPGGPPRAATWPLAPLGLALAWAYVFVPDLLPALHPADTARIVSGSVAIVLIVAVAVTVAALSEAAIVVPIFLLGSALIAGAMDAAGVGAAATVPETVAYACIGMLFGVLLDSPALVLAVPVFVGGIDAISLLGGTSHTLSAGAIQSGDPLSLDLPEWHTGLSAARFGLADVVFCGIYATYARRLGLRFVAGAIGMAAGLVLALVLQVTLDTPMPALAFLGAGFLAPNIDRIVALFRATVEG
jgi:hypothetical protein